MVFVVEGTSLQLSAALFPRYVPKQEQSSIHTQNKQKSLFSSKTIMEFLIPRGFGVQGPPHLPSVSVGHCGLSGVQNFFCWDFKSFCFPQASSLEFVLGWKQESLNSISECRGEGRDAPRGLELGHFPLCRCFVRAGVGRRPQPGSVLLKNCFHFNFPGPTVLLCPTLPSCRER